MRRSGILLHPTSLPGIAGSGSIGSAAREFIDFLARADQQIWQILPLVPVDDGGCPYNSTSAMAYNARLIDLLDLTTTVFAQILELEDLEDAPVPEDPKHCDFRMTGQYKEKKLELAYDRLQTLKTKEAKALVKAFETFKADNAHWLDDYALFTVLQKALEKPVWSDWPAPLRNRDAKAIEEARNMHAAEIERVAFGQFIFHKQWTLLQQKAKQAGVKLMGDVPIFVSFNSVDVWAHRDNFQICKRSGKPRNVAGVPPDYFSPEGQLWGNPLYDWKSLKSSDYAWWKERLGAIAQLVDIVRIDHFRGFEAFWQVNAKAENAIDGKWVKGPGLPFFEAMRKAHPQLEIVAEDLGINTPAVEQLRKDADFPGMRILQFGFPLDEANDHHAPHRHERDAVVYTGTHDNNTIVGWFHEIGHEQRDKVRHYLAIDGKDIAWQMIRAAFASVADTAIIPAQDLLGLDGSARFNVPGVAEGNWTWRLTESLPQGIAKRLKEMTHLYGRAPMVEEVAKEEEAAKVDTEKPVKKRRKTKK